MERLAVSKVVGSRHFGHNSRRLTAWAGQTVTVTKSQTA